MNNYVSNRKDTEITSYSTNNAKKLKSKRPKLILSTVVILAVLAVFGWLVIQNRNAADSFTKCLNTKDSKTTASDTGSVCVTDDGKKFESQQAKAVEWTSYNRDPISFYYPPDWTVTNVDPPPTYGKDSIVFRVSGSNDQSLTVTPEPLSDNRILTGVIALKPPKQTNTQCNCTVLAAKGFIFRSNNKKAQLLAVDINGNKQADLLIIGPESAQVSDTKVNKFDLSSKYQLVVQAYVVDQSRATDPDSQYEVKDAQGFLSSTSSSLLIALLSGITLK